MPQLTDRSQIRAILETDRPWAAYALADLEPGFFAYTHWFAAEHGAVQRLYTDGEARGEAPAWFQADMLAHGVYYGIRKNGELLAVAGTQVVGQEVEVGCVGNIYTRRDQRGHGLSTHVTSAVTAHLVALGLQTIALNVREHNAAVIHVYERLGFQCYCGFLEAVATKRSCGAP